MKQETFAFVLMPFDESFNDLYRLAIKDPLAQIGIRAERVDEQKFHEETILQRIYNQIEAADFVVADMTGRNPNVFYEVGYAHAKGKTCILLTASTKDIPFDLKHHRHIVYRANNYRQLRDGLVAECEEVKRRIDESHHRLTVETTCGSGYLEKTKWIATGEVEITFDFTNTTGATFQIEAAYFYTGAKWKFKQDGHECPSTKSDIGDYTARHFIKPPMARVPKDGWARATIKGEKQLGTAYKGEKLLDVYPLKGNVLLRVQTDKGTFDYKTMLNVIFDELPF